MSRLPKWFEDYERQTYKYLLIAFVAAGLIVIIGGLLGLFISYLIS